MFDLNNIGGKGKLLLFIVLMTTIGTILVFWTGGLPLTIIMTFVIVTVLYVSKSIWLPRGYGKTKTRNLSLLIVFSTALSFSFWNSYINQLLIQPMLMFLQNNFSVFKNIDFPQSTPSIIVLIFVLIGVFIVNYLMRDKTAMGVPTTSFDKEFPEKTYNQDMESLCRLLIDDLNKIDNETRWSSELFTPIDAEVEVQTKNNSHKKITDLLFAIKSNKTSKVFLVLGDPGSGKSVALRKLCRDLLKEAPRTGKIPIYINLKEWITTNNWTEDNLPNVEDVYSFVLNNLKQRLDVFGNDILNKYFKTMVNNGRFFIILDSFDEIPSILDESNNSWLINHVSDIIFRFLSGAHDSRGLLSSRYFRKPSSNFSAQSNLEIFPLSDSKIVKLLEKSINFNENLINLIFMERPDFITLARNPFTAALISNYAKDNSNTLPENQIKLYENYISNRLLSCIDKIKSANLTIEQINMCLKKIALFMFNDDAFGLEAPIDIICKELHSQPVRQVISIITYARVGRLGNGTDQLFSFVHRRFNEYYVALALLDDPSIISLESIPTDSRWRDALVMFCEIGEKNDVIKIAEFCWLEVKKIKDNNLKISSSEYLRGIHCLRFLRDAFRTKLSCLESFQNELSDFINYQITERESILEKKLAVEAVGLLKDKDIDSLIISALNINNSWVSEYAFKGSRHLKKASGKLVKSTKKHFLNIDLFDLFKKRHDYIFSLKLSQGYLPVLNLVKNRVYEIYSSVIGILLLFVLNPFTTFIVLGLMVFTFLLSELLSRFFEINSILKVELLRAQFSILMFGILINPTYGLIQNSILIIALIFIFPWQYANFHLFNLMKIKILFLFGLFISISLFFSLLYISNNIGVFERVLYIVSITLSFFLLSALLRYIFLLYIDLRAIKKINLQDSISRIGLENTLNKFKTSIGKVKYLKRIQFKKCQLIGGWSNEGVPNYKHESIDTILAQLDEKWFNLS